LAEEGLTF